MLQRFLRGELTLTFVAMWILAIIAALTLHEVAHGFAAYLAGDRTAKRDGRLSLDPRRHIDPLGILFLVVMGFGWAKPVMVSPHNFKNRKWGMALTALAGPVTNFVLAFIGLFIQLSIWVFATVVPNTPVWHFLQFLGLFFQVNVLLGVFNMLPIPPLDGSKVFGALLDDETYFRFISFPYGMPILMILVIFGGLGPILEPMMDFVTRGYSTVIFRILQVIYGG